ncbi:hypothetical protein [Streptomyces rhizosphaerihabitans]|uniref:hypothetical protein n=1 Tax=Streptomyces rhizosphaerihabitans TaxID=1266770 RepID=UPI0021BF4478|nr:hypothetical protein [Streptomyces rhizosphaerihabitans]MCT9010697.1 hypothetical protein [Streptomyces rhizosphaerihabitans]WRZ90606.1 hypothetical protein OHB54_16925 [Streptomyces sp. NBC_01007]
MRHKIAALAATTVLLAGGALATATSASATVDPPSGGWDHTWTTTDSNNGGTVYIAEHGDHVSVCDTAADGYAPRVRIANEEQTVPGAYDTRYTLTASGGEGSCVSASASQGGVYDLPENVKIGVTVYLGPDYKYQSTHYYLNDN